MIDTTPKKARLTVDASPANAKIRLLNITPAYESGMILDPGPYHIEVSAPGFKTSREWVTLETNEEKTVEISLAASSAGQQETGTKPSVVVKKDTFVPPPPPPPPSQQVNTLTSEQAKYLRMLESNDSKQQKNAAQLMVRAKYKDTVVLDVVEKVLLNGYKAAGTDRNDQVDTLSWLCKALGASGQSKYRPTLTIVAQNAPHRKLKGYAEKSLQGR